MAKPPKGSSQNLNEVGTPKEFPQVSPPVELYATSDIRFVMVELGKVGTKVDRLIEDTNKNAEKISDLSKTVAKFETTVKVGSACIAIVIAIIIWFFGDIIKSTVSNSIKAAVIENARQGTATAPTTK